MVPDEQNLDHWNTVSKYYIKKGKIYEIYLNEY